eukprot:3771647-Rhodomonas_salina.1
MELANMRTPNSISGSQRLAFIISFRQWTNNLPVEFWGLASLYIVESYNVLQHSGIHNKIPYEEHTRRSTDVSWFRPFGCRVTVFRKKDHVDHHKISPWGEPGVFVGLGTAENKKAWLVYVPRLNKIFASHDLQFDETFFPLRAEDQRVYGTFDYNVVKEMLASNQFVTLDQQAPSL